jgi:hypothetical protein
MSSTVAGTKRDNVIQNWKRVSPEATRFLLPIRTKQGYRQALELLEEAFSDESLEPFLQVLSEPIEASQHR